jgi:hypothetical protein
MSAHLLGIPALLFFFILVVFVLRSRRVSWLDVVILVCFGYYLGGSTFGVLLNEIVTDLGSIVGGVH